MNVLLKSIFSHDFTNHIPNLITFLSSQESESAWLINTKEIHSINHEILFSKLKIEDSFAFFFIFSCYHTKWKTSSFSTIIRNVIQSKERSIASQKYSIW